MPSNITLEDASAAYQCSKYGAGSCSVAVTQGITVGAAAGAAGAAGGAAAAYGSIDAAVASGLASGTASSATSYIGNGLFTGDMSFGEGFRQTMIGGFSGAIGSGVSYGVGTSGVNILGNTSAEILGSAVAGGFGKLANGGNFWDGFGNGALMATASAFLTSTANFFTDRVDNDGRVPESGKISKDGSQLPLREGDVVVMERDGSAGSNAIAWLSGEDYTHAAIVERSVDNPNELVFREANKSGIEIQTRFKEYAGRRFKVVDNRPALRNFNQIDKGYFLLWRNCATQASKWTGIRWTNNPGVLARYMGTVSPRYYNSFSLQGLVW